MIKEKEIVRFPINMGISGYALKGNAVCFINDFALKSESDDLDLMKAQTSSSRDKVLTLAQQAFIGKILARKYPYNKKIDNFMELETIHNIVCSSITDDERIGKLRPVGVLQLYNKDTGHILQDDLVRIHYIRKLVGSMMIKCEMYAIMMQMTVGIAENYKLKQNIEKNAHKIKYGHMQELESYIRAFK